MDLVNYLAGLAQEGYQASTQARKTFAIRRFFQFLAEGEMLAPNPFATVPAPRLGRHERLALSEPEYRALREPARKVSDGVARIKHWLARELPLGNLAARRGWGFAGDYVEAMWRMLQQPTPEDYVIATGETHTVRELCEIAFARAGLRCEDHVVVDPAMVRPAEVDLLQGDAAKAKPVLRWAPKVNFPQLIEMMVEADLARQASHTVAKAARSRRT